MKKLAIVGTAESTIQMAPYNNNEYDIWALNGVYNMIDLENISNITRWFDLHSLEVIKAEPRGYFEWYKTCKIPVYTIEVNEEMPSSVKYPLDEILKRFPRKYFTNTVSYMIALAIYEGYTNISIFGVDMQRGAEYSDQRPSCEYFIGYAEGLGINVYIPPQSDILYCPYLYGFEEEKINAIQAKINARIIELSKRKASYEQQADTATAAVHHLDGCIKDAQYMLGVWL